MIETSHTFSVEYAPAVYIRTKATKKEPAKDQLAWYAGGISLSDGGVTISPPRHAYDISCGLPAITVKPEHLDALVAALQEARVIGRHLYGKKEVS